MTTSVTTVSVTASVPIFELEQSFAAWKELLWQYLAAKSLKDAFEFETDPRLEPGHLLYPGVMLANPALVMPGEPNTVANTAAERERVKYEVTMHDRLIVKVTKEFTLRDNWRLQCANGMLVLQTACAKSNPDAWALVKTETSPRLAWITLANCYRGAIGGIVTDKAMIQVAKDKYNATVFHEGTSPAVLVAQFRTLMTQLEGTTSAITEGAFLDDVISRFSRIPLYEPVIEKHQDDVGLTVVALVNFLTLRYNRTVTNGTGGTPAVGFYAGVNTNSSVSVSGSNDVPPLINDNNVFRTSVCKTCHQHGHNEHACKIWRAANPLSRRNKKKKDGDDGITMLAVGGFSTSPRWSVPSLLLLFLVLCVGLSCGSANFH